MQLSRLQPGVDVPWVTRWSAEALQAAGPCPELGGRPAVRQEDRPGFGRPIYSENHFVRQRTSVLRRLCPMCGGPTVEDDRWSLTASLTSAGELRARGLGHLVPPLVPGAQPVLNAGSIAPLHLACAERSAIECPHLRGMETRRLIAFPRRCVLVPLMVEARDTGPGHAVLARPPTPVAVVGFVQILGLPDAAETAAARRARPR